MQNHCFVFVHPPNAKHGVPAGRLEFLEDDSVRFAYGLQYAANPASCAVDPINLPLLLGATAKVMTGGRLGALRDAIPDYWGRLVLARQLNKYVEELALSDLFIFGNCLRIGNLEFRFGFATPAEEPYFPQYSTLAELLILAEKIENDSNLTKKEDALLPLLVHGCCIGGARPKCTVEDEGLLWIAKFPSIHDSWSNARVEYATMNIAAACGINVPSMRLVDVGGKDVLLIERFDRKPLDSGGYGRAGYLSALSFMNYSDNDAYSWSYLGIASALRRYSPEGSQFLFERMVFNILCRNTDDHPRNHGFLVDGDGLRLSPAFDITPTIYRPGVNTMPSQAMGIGNYGREGSLRNALSRPELFGFTKAQAFDVVSKMLSSLCIWRQCFEEAGVPEKDIEKFKNTFENRCMDGVEELH
jgi:serine/threonine-protein kinase HipA